MQGQIKSFSDKKELKEFITTKPVLQEMMDPEGIVLSEINQRKTNII